MSPAPALLLALLGAAPAARAASVDQLRAALDGFNAHARAPLPPLDERDLARLAAGDMVRKLDREVADVGPARLVGLAVLPLSRRAVWLATQDPHFAGDDGLVEALVQQQGADRARWYGYLDVPRPFADRQWVIDVWNEHAVARATGGVAWEHPWQVAPEGLSQVAAMVAAGEVPPLTPAALEGAIATPLNEGAWVAIELGPEETLLAYHCRFDVGGRIPDGLMSQYLLSTFPQVFRSVADRARHEVPGHYVSGHEPVPGGDGVALPRYGGGGAASRQAAPAVEAE